MKRFSEYRSDLILEFANIGPATHRLGVNFKMHIMQIGDVSKLPHGPRVKFFNNEHEFVVTLEEEPRIIGKCPLSIGDAEKLRVSVKHYRSAFLQFWHDPKMDQDELRLAMDNLDKQRI
jgi:hypothetical protein